MNQERVDSERKRLLLKSLADSALSQHQKDLFRELVEGALEPSDNLNMGGS